MLETSQTLGTPAQAIDSTFLFITLLQASVTRMQLALGWASLTPLSKAHKWLALEIWLRHTVNPLLCLTLILAHLVSMTLTLRQAVRTAKLSLSTLKALSLILIVVKTPFEVLAIR